MKLRSILAVTFATLGAHMAAAQRQPSTSASNPLVEALADCQAIHDDVRRLSCYDTAAGRMVAAERRQDVVIVNREDVRKARRSLFGLALGPNDVFAGRSSPSDRIEKLDTTLLSAREIGNGRWSLILTEGGRWQTTEAWTLTADLKSGMNVTIHPGALGSYVARVGNQRAVRVQRVN